MQAVAEMAKKKKMKPRDMVVGMRGTPEWKQWLEGLADHSHLPMAILIEHALREYAERHGYAEPQPKR